MKAPYYRAAGLQDVLRWAGELPARTVVFDVEPLAAAWDSGQDVLDRGTSCVLGEVTAAPGVRVVCFATNSARRPSDLPDSAGGVQVVYLASARKPLPHRLRSAGSHGGRGGGRGGAGARRSAG